MKKVLVKHSITPTTSTTSPEEKKKEWNRLWFQSIQISIAGFPCSSKVIIPEASWGLPKVQRGPVWSWGWVRSLSGHADCPGVSSQGWISLSHFLRKSWHASCGLCFQACSSSCNSSKIKEGAEAVSQEPKDTHHTDPVGDAWQRSRI